MLILEIRVECTSLRHDIMDSLNPEWRRWVGVLNWVGWYGLPGTRDNRDMCFIPLNRYNSSFSVWIYHNKNPGIKTPLMIDPWVTVMVLYYSTVQIHGGRGRTALPLGTALPLWQRRYRRMSTVLPLVNTLESMDLPDTPRRPIPVER